MRRTLIALLALLSLGWVVVLHIHAANLGRVREMAAAHMTAGLVLIWIFVGGTLMWRLRELSSAWLRRLPGGWRTRFVLGCIIFACAEEAVTVSMTNLAPLFGAHRGEAFITASANWFDVVLFHSVVAFVPLFLALTVVLRFWDLSPFAVFMIFGTIGTISEAMFAGSPAMLIAFPMWVFVYGLMVFLPACALPPAAERGARPALWYHVLLAFPVIYAIALPMILPIALVIDAMGHPQIHFQLDP